LSIPKPYYKNILIILNRLYREKRVTQDVYISSRLFGFSREQKMQASEALEKASCDINLLKALQAKEKALQKGNLGAIATRLAR
jgi:hypothetical protein